MEREEWIRRRAYELWQLAGEPDGQSDQFWLVAEQESLTDLGELPDAAPEDAAHDSAVADSFPASDPPAASGITGPGTATTDETVTPEPAEAPPAAKSRAARVMQKVF